MNAIGRAGAEGEKERSLVEPRAFTPEAFGGEYL
jgi:hypothetical protein